MRETCAADRSESLPPRTLRALYVSVAHEGHSGAEGKGSVVMCVTRGTGMSVWPRGCARVCSETHVGSDVTLTDGAGEDERRSCMHE